MLSFPVGRLRGHIAFRDELEKLLGGIEVGSAGLIRAVKGAEVDREVLY